jgi:Rrf2 family transcriptional regulator, iron-sulfur cluster assembly transcription factor
MLFLAEQAPGKLSPVREIASHYGVSEAYLAKILQRLASCGLVRSFRGPGKGTELGRAPDAISLATVICAVEGPKELENCVLGLGLCSEDNPCALHSEWLPLRSAIHDFLEKTTLADLVNVMQRRSADPNLRFAGKTQDVAEARDTFERKRL